MQHQNLQHLIALSLLPRVGSISAKNLLEHFGEAPEIFSASKRALLQLHGIGESTADLILKARDNALRKAEKELEFIEKYQIKVLMNGEADYPQRLQVYEDAPLLLYYKGSADLNAQRIVSIVGTRRPTERGKAFCQKIVQDLQAYNVLIVSGLALGIDITAHRKCLELGMENIGIVAHGLDDLYPAAHRQTAGQMVQRGGILTEFVSQTAPLQQNFPMRNRIIAGMSDAVVVVETARTGGSMITAYFANEYQKDVFALPGRIEDEFSAGCNLLIKSHRAALIESAEDIAYVMRWQSKKSDYDIAKTNANRYSSLFIELNEEEKKVLEILAAHEKGLHLDSLLQTAQMSTSRMAILLLELEFKGLLCSLPGKVYKVVQKDLV